MGPWSNLQAIIHTFRRIRETPGLDYRGAGEDPGANAWRGRRAALRESDALEAFVPFSINFVTQKNQAFCGVASIVMVLNALQLPAPAVPEYDPYRTFTQDNFLNEKTETILPQDVLAKLGMTLDQLGELLATQPVEVQLHHAADVHRSDRLAPA